MTSLQIVDTQVQNSLNAITGDSNTAVQVAQLSKLGQTTLLVLKDAGPTPRSAQDLKDYTTNPLLLDVSEVGDKTHAIQFGADTPANAADLLDALGLSSTFANNLKRTLIKMQIQGASLDPNGSVTIGNTGAGTNNVQFSTAGGAEGDSAVICPLSASAQNGEILIMASTGSTSAVGAEHIVFDVIRAATA